MKAWIANVPIATKLAIAPIFALIGLSSLALGSYLVLQSVRSDVEYLNKVAFARSHEVAQMRAAISRAQTKLYEIAAYSANSSDPGAIEARQKQLVDQMGQVRAQSNILASTDPDAAHLMAAGINKWQESATGAAEMIVADAALGLTFMAPAEDAFSALSVAIDNLAMETDASRNLTFERAIAKITSAGVGSVALIVLLAAALGAVTLKLTGAIKNPISRLTEDMSRLAAGDLLTDVAATERQDEIGAMARAVAVFKTNAIKSQSLEEEKRGSLQRERERGARLGEAVTAFEREVQDLTRMLMQSAHDLSGAADRMSISSKSASQQALFASNNIVESNQQMQMMASSAEQLSSAINEISKQMTMSSDMTSKAAEGGRRANRTIEELALDAEQIGHAVTMIHHIARKTNLLALNATIEAGRAGPQGKGFAIVASEVKDLANQAAAATEAIGGQVTAIQRATTDAVSAIREIGSTIDNVDLVAATIASAVEEQQAATRTISESVALAARGSDEISARIMELTEASGEVGRASTLVSSSAKELLTKAETLRAQVNEFLTAVRAA